MDTWWQTETGGIAISPRPSGQGADILPAKPMRPMLGMNPALLNDQGETKLVFEFQTSIILGAGQVQLLISVFR